MIFVKHRSASGTLDELWEYDPARRVVMLTFRQGAAEPVSVDVPVASEPFARFGAWKIVRGDEQTWEILPHRFGVVSLRPFPIHASLGSASVVLCGAPFNVSVELDAA